ncbi:MAG: Fic family protein [Prevotellaceae bacterium]|jgi:Fic family protein|nr:Fic family protein [Prevotellaceae bacterium]
MEDFFTNNPLWCEKTGKIYALLERVKISEEQSKDVLHLRKANRILSVGATTAIEGNRLTAQQVFDVVNGKVVFAPLHDIKEVKNAFSAYEQIPDLDPYSVDDFLKSHRCITENLVQEAGQFRTVGVVVANSRGEILHSGADYKDVPRLVAELLAWGKATDAHPIIKSAAVHFMVEHIHPFRDGNGRIGRLWQTLILAKWSPVFEWMPVETMIYHSQQKYYDALQQSHKNKIDCRPFIDFMFDIIEAAICRYADSEKSAIGGINGGLFGGLNALQKEIIALIQENPNIRAFEMAQKLLKPVRTVENNLSWLKEKGIISRVGSKKTGCWKIIA